MFYCSKCDQDLPESLFYKRKNGNKQPWCKPCRKQYFLERYNERSSYIRKLKEVPCNDCGIVYHYAVMQFDHIKGIKKFDISRAISTNIKWDKIIQEIEKCEVVCANCHAMRTFKRRSRIVA